MKRGKPGQEGQERTLPLLPLSTHVLLPGGMLTVAVHGNSHLIKHLVHEQGRDVMVAAVPYSPDNGEDRGPADSEGDQPLDHDRLFHTGTAAKVVQLHKSAKVFDFESREGRERGLSVHVVLLHGNPWGLMFRNRPRPGWGIVSV